MAMHILGTARGTDPQSDARYNTGGLMILVSNAVHLDHNCHATIDPYAHCVCVRMKKQNTCIINVYFLFTDQAVAFATMHKVHGFIQGITCPA